MKVTNGQTAERSAISAEAYAEVGRIYREAGISPALVREVSRDPRLECLAPIADAMDREAGE